MTGLSLKGHFPLDWSRLAFSTLPLSLAVGTICPILHAGHRSFKSALAIIKTNGNDIIRTRKRNGIKKAIMKQGKWTAAVMQKTRMRPKNMPSFSNDPVCIYWHCARSQMYSLIGDPLAGKMDFCYEATPNANKGAHGPFTFDGIQCKTS